MRLATTAQHLRLNDLAGYQEGVQVKLKMLIARDPPQISEPFPVHATVQLEGTFALTESPHMHCLPFETPASLPS